jgi:hypothetical protein
MNTDALIAHARARFDHVAARRVLKEKYEARMLFAHAGGMWRAGPELQCTLLSCAQDKDVVLLDLYETPVRVNVPELFARSHGHWQEQMNAWLVEYDEQSKKR